MSDDQFTKLAKQINLGFKRVDKKLENHDSSFEQMFLSFERRFTEVYKRFDKVDQEILDLKLSVAELAGLIKDYHQEMVMLTHKVDRLERWIHEIADKTGVKLST